MTETEINTAIAKACGWTDIMGCPGFACTEVFPRGKFNGTFSPLPNYCRDLNAMAEAEKILRGLQRDLYADHLCAVVRGVGAGYYSRVDWGLASEIISATARQRAESFLRTLGVWKEES